MTSVLSLVLRMKIMVDDVVVCFGSYGDVGLMYQMRQGVAEHFLPGVVVITTDQPINSHVDIENTQIACQISVLNGIT